MKSLIFHFPRRAFRIYTVQKHKRANFLPLILAEASEVNWRADGWPRKLSVSYHCLPYSLLREFRVG